MTSPAPSTYAAAMAADTARYAAQLDGSYLTRQAEFDTACADAWRAHLKTFANVRGPSEAQALGFTSL